MLRESKMFKKILLGNSKRYWEKRYKQGRTSGKGSYGIFAEYKADILNEFIKKHEIKTVVDLGCGDGNQLNLIDCQYYVGLDVSETVIARCKELFKEDTHKSFYLYDLENFSDRNFKADLAISLDVIYHLLEDRIFVLYMEHLFTMARQYVIIYSSNTNKQRLLQASHIRHRRFTDWISENTSHWHLINVFKNPYKSVSDFYFYERVEQ